MAISVHILLVLVLFMLAGVIPTVAGTQGVVFRTPVFIASLALLALALVVCSLRRRLTLRRWGFVLTHLGVAVILSGALIGYMGGKRGEFALPISGEHVVREIPLREGESLKLKFGFCVTEFDVQFYAPSYGLYRPPTVSAAGDQGEYEHVGDFRLSADGVMDVGSHGMLTRTDLADETSGEWKAQYVLSDGWILQLVPPTPRRFAAELRLVGESGDETTQELAVNHPVEFGGWRFYLMSYDKEARRYVVLSARRDPGRGVVIAGIWMVIVGTAGLCLRRSRERAA